jgi:hypothetical protein
MRNYFVYALIDPRNNLPFYIGKGTIKNKKGGRYQRLKAHFWKSSKGINPFKDAVMFKIESDGLTVKAEIISDNLTEKESLDLERSQISFYGRRNINSGILTNLTDGGESFSGYVFSEERKNQARERMMERIQKFGPYILTDQDKAKASQAQKLRFQNQEGTMKGKKHSEETKSKLSAIRKQKGCNLPPEERHRFGSPKEKNFFAKKTIFISPDGETFEVIGEFRKFVKEHNLSIKMCQVYLNQGPIPPPIRTAHKTRVNSTGWEIQRK